MSNKSQPVYLRECSRTSKHYIFIMMDEIHEAKKSYMDNFDNNRHILSLIRDVINVYEANKSHVSHETAETIVNGLLSLLNIPYSGRGRKLEHYFNKTKAYQLKSNLLQFATRDYLTDIFYNCPIIKGDDFDIRDYTNIPIIALIVAVILGTFIGFIVS